jgi:hypothetical protein
MEKRSMFAKRRKSYITIEVITFLLLLLTDFSGIAQEKWRKEAVKADPIVCYASKEAYHTFVLPPPEFLNRLKSAKKQADIILNYVNFPDSLKPAMEYAVQIWESLIQSSVPIHMEVNWEKLASDVLGSCGATVFYSNFDNAPIPNTYYSIALVEKITGKEQSCPSDSPDLIARFNSQISWYSSTDGKTSSQKYDFVSIALHEITHGLGFTGYLQVNTATSTGFWANSAKYPSIFDQYIEDFNKRRLTNTTYYKNSSNTLYKALTSNQLYSGSPVAYAWGFENRPRLYVPSVFSNGSSIYHLNDATYLAGTENSLMTHSAGTGEAIHSPGPLTAGIMGDLGWKNLTFSFKPVTIIEGISKPVKIDLRIQSDFGVKEKSTFLVFSYDGFLSQRDSLQFTPQDSLYTISILPTVFPAKISYYITSTDTMGRRFTYPAQAPSRINTINLKADFDKPEVYHKSIAYILPGEKEFLFTTQVIDSMGVDNVQLISSLNGTNLPSQIFSEGENSWFYKQLNLSNLGLRTGDSIAYSIKATDISKRNNSTQLPGEGNFMLKVEKIEKPLTAYSTNFDDQNSDFILADFEIAKPVDFDNPALQSPHPYASPDRDNGILDFTTVLRYPVIVSAKGKISFDEVVLVEPGEESVPFGCQDFFDYVIVEGSKDFGNNWLPLHDGYDSGSQTSWLTTYNQQLVSNNSTATGNKNLYINRNFSLTENGNFKEGDTLLIRFRLYSDPFAHGWGWAIDNLKIQEDLTPVAEMALSPGNFLIWPNPASDFFNLEVNQPEITPQIELYIHDITGRVLKRSRFNNIIPGTITRVEIQNIPSGLFFITLISKGIPVFTQKMVKY